MRLLAGLALTATLCAWLAGCGDDDSTPAVDGTGADAGRIDALLYDARLECPAEPPPTCDYFLSCGCATPGEKCSARESGPTCATAGNLIPGDVCTSDDECMGGTYCIAAVPGEEKRCRRYCDDVHPCVTSPATACYLTLKDGDGQAIGRVCEPVCSLLNQDCASESQGCFPAAAYVSTPEKGICVIYGMGGQGFTCAIGNDCQEGFTCVDPGNGKPICAQLCRRAGGAPACESPLACKILVGHTETGVCMP